MLRFLSSLALIAVLAASVWAQAPDSPQPAAPAAQNPTETQGSTVQPAQKQPSRLKEHFKSWCFDLVLPMCWNFAKPAPSSTEPSPEAQEPRNPPPPRSTDQGSRREEESSSNDTKIDLSPPPGDATHPGSVASDINEFHAYDPHRAEKDVEVGDFYFKRKNYGAAISRYRSALKWKPNDALATFRLAQALEKTGRFSEAGENYQGYLKILPHGEFAQESKDALQRLASRSESRSQSEPKPR